MSYVHKVGLRAHRAGSWYKLGHGINLDMKLALHYQVRVGSVPCLHWWIKVGLVFCFPPLSWVYFAKFSDALSCIVGLEHFCHTHIIT